MTATIRSASRHWLIQRLTAAVMAAYVLVALGLVFTAAPFSYDSWQSVFRDTWTRSFTVLFSLCLAWHAAIGVQDILRDYIKGQVSRAILLALAYLLLIGFVVKAVNTLWS